LPMARPRKNPRRIENAQHHCTRKCNSLTRHHLPTLTV
jgi:hypothetical protein